MDISIYKVKYIYQVEKIMSILNKYCFDLNFDLKNIKIKNKKLDKSIDPNSIQFFVCIQFGPVLKLKNLKFLDLI